MVREKQHPQQVGIQSNDGGDIHIDQSQVHIAGGDLHVYYSSAEGALDAEQRLNRARMLAKVRSTWITNFLNRSHLLTPMIALSFREQPDALANPWEELVQAPELREQSVLLEKDITQSYEAFQEIGEELLILGEPGSGKTILLLEITRALLDHAMQDITYPIPVVFNLSSWGARRPPLANWLVEELHRRYRVPLNVAKVWIARHQVALLLDGLDEVAAPHRATCVEAINAYRQAAVFLPTVVCSRQADYLALSTRLLLRSAVTVQPLTPAQIERAVISGGQGLGALREALHKDADMLALASTPLMLYVLTAAYQGVSLEKIAATGSPDMKQRQVFADYVQLMLQRRGPETRYTLEQTRHWLIWLAKQMKQRNQSVFYLEDLQSDWLSNSRLYHYSTSLGIGLLSFLIMLPADVVLFKSLLSGILVACLDAVLAIPFVWLIGRGKLRNTFFFRWDRKFPFFVLNKQESAFNKEGKWSKEHPGANAFFELLLWNTLVFAVLNGFLDGMLVQHLNSFYSWDHGLFYATFYIVFGTLSHRIEPAEKLVWSWASARGHAASSLLLGGLVGFLLGLSNALTYVASPITFLATLSFGLLLGIAIGWVVMLMRGFSNSKLDEKEKIKPNQGIKNSFSNSTLIGTVSGLAFGFVVFLFYFLGFYFKIGYLGIDKRFPPQSDLIYGVSDGLTVAYLYWLRKGGFACVQHLMVRVCLCQTNRMPWNYVRFLDAADERILLRKAGGGYIFYHKLLLEYFANLNKDASSNRLIVGRKQTAKL